MQIEQTPGIVFKFRRPSGTPSRQPSEAMTQAMRQFAETDEMQAFIANARAQRRKVVVEVFHSADGYPMLIHTTILRKKTA
jgi:uncharacterized protein (DUF2141 family)